MDRQRWREIELGQKNLTPEEIEEGWHFCPDWDEMLICKYQKKGEYCTCQGFKLND